MRGLREFVPGGFPLPASPIYDGIGDFVPGGFPLPQTPVYYVASVNGSLPKSPALTQADLAPLPAADSSSCGMGCGCSSCGGMGALDMSSITNMIPGTTFGISNTYLAIGAVLAVVAFSSMGGRRRR
jgi:hypothetical protein